jgi:DNA ligase-associated metallophosphoesterase
VPRGTTSETLDLLSSLVATWHARRVVFLGDFLHSERAHAPATLGRVARWRRAHASLELILVRGNHDSRAGDPPPSLRIEIVDEPWLVGPFACCHHPQAHATHFVLAGHLHPACSLHGRGRDSVRLPCFVQEDGQAVLPAFGEFTGGLYMEPLPGRRFYGIGGDAVWALPA